MSTRTRPDPYSVYLLEGGPQREPGDPTAELRHESAEYLAKVIALSRDPNQEYLDLVTAVVAFMQVKLDDAPAEVRTQLAEAATLRTRWSA